MAMVVRSNLNALNANRQLGMNNSQVAKSLEKLSSGFRINRAGDDASGLAISEKMKAQIKGLEQASANSQDGISLVQTAEGAMTEVHNMLNRMTELATKSANGTISDKVDREAIQREVDQLSEEIDRIGDSTNFNGINLLDGNLSSAGKASTTGVDNGKTAVTLAGAVKGTNNVSTASTFKSGALVVGTVTDQTLTYTIDYTDSKGAAKKLTVTGAKQGAAFDHDTFLADVKAAAAKDAEFSSLFDITKGAAVGDAVHFTSKATGSGAATVTGFSFTSDKSGTSLAAGASVAGTDKSMTLDVAGISAVTTKAAEGSVLTIGGKTYELLNDLTKVKEGNIAVKLGTTTGTEGAETLDNLVKALNQNGVKSAKTIVKADGTAGSATTATAIKISDLSEIETAQKGVTVSSAAGGIDTRNAKAVAGVYSIQGVAGGAAVASKFTLDFKDNEGNDKSITVDYTSSNADADTNTKAILAALQQNDDFNANFEGKFTGTGTTSAIQLTAKKVGTEGAKVISTETTDTTNKMSTITTTTKATNDRKELKITEELIAGDTVEIDGKTYEFVTDITKAKEGNVGVVLDDTATTGIVVTAKNLAAALKTNGVEFAFNAGDGTISFDDAAVNTTGQGGLTLQVGDTNDAFNKVSVQVDDVRSEGLGIKGLKVGTQETAGTAIKTIKDAINKVSTNRGNLGALQNRLEYAINNLDVTAENMSSANSRIRDTDMAKEMMNYTKMNVLTQSAQAMLAQANQAPQSILQLLQ